MKILFKLTTRGRPELMFRTIDSIVNNISDKVNYYMIITADHDDETMRIDKIRAKCDTYDNQNIKLIWGYSKGKIDAINRDMNLIDYDWDILVNVSDDQVFIKKGFDEDIRNTFEIDGYGFQCLPDLDQFIHFPDGNRADICTMSIMGRDYYERDKRIYYNGYKSICCDDDATAEAKLRGCYKFVNTQIFIHDHYQWKDGVVCHRPDKFDSTYKMNDRPEIHKHDYDLLDYRKSINFGVK